MEAGEGALQAAEAGVVVAGSDEAAECRGLAVRPKVRCLGGAAAEGGVAAAEACAKGRCPGQAAVGLHFALCDHLGQEPRLLD